MSSNISRAESPPNVPVAARPGFPRGVAQHGGALVLGAGDREFKSRHSGRILRDHELTYVGSTTSACSDDSGGYSTPLGKALTSCTSSIIDVEISCLLNKFSQRYRAGC